MVLEGTSRLDAACQAGMDRQTLRDWVHRYNETGLFGLASRKAPGAAPKLSTAQMAELRELVIAGPDPEVDKVIRWRCVDLCAEVVRRFAVTVPERTIAKWLLKLKLTRLQPRSHHPKADAAAQAAFKKASSARPAACRPDRRFLPHLPRPWTLRAISYHALLRGRAFRPEVPNRTEFKWPSLRGPTMPPPRHGGPKGRR
nr:helix-turn-helix domain-containing protein [uncultured Rhodopila sp.]